MLLKDKILLNLYESNKRSFLCKIKKHHNKIVLYLLSKYENISNWQEIFYRIKYNITDIPLCKTCGKPVKFQKFTVGYATYCCNKCAQLNPDIIKKKEQTCALHFGTKYYWNSSESKAKLKEKYGSENIFSTDYGKQKIKEHSLKKYGVEYPAQNEQIKIKQANTCFNRYNSYFPCQNKQILSKMINTKLEKYGEIGYNEKARNTFYKKHGVNYPFQLPEILEKCHKSAIINGTEHKSYPEDKLNEILSELYNDVKHNIKTEKYPYWCDFYIPEFNLYIEYQGFWTHGTHLFNELNTDDINLKQILEKKEGLEYKNYLKNWTIKDVEKYNVAKKNKINFLSLYYICDEFLKLCKYKHDNLYYDDSKIFIKQLIENNFSNTTNKQLIITKN